MQVHVFYMDRIGGKRDRHLRARFHVHLNCTPSTGVSIYGLRLMRTAGNWWFAVPSRKSKAGIWEKLVTMSPDIHEATLQAALEKYRPGSAAK